MTSPPVDAVGPSGPVGRSVGEIRALCEAATPGPWSFYLGDLWAGATADELATADRLSAEHVFSDEAEDIFERASHLFHGDPERPEDAEFIAAARDLVPSLLAEVEAAHRFEQAVELERNGLAVAALTHHLAYISRTVTASYPDGMDAELVMRRRVGKIWVEAGELGDAIEGWTGENPRKGTYAARHDVVKELIDCASASLCAVEYMTGDKGDSLALLAAQVAGNAQRLSESIPDTCGPSPAVAPEASS